MGPDLHALARRLMVQGSSGSWSVHPTPVQEAYGLGEETEGVGQVVYGSQPRDSWSGGGGEEGRSDGSRSRPLNLSTEGQTHLKTSPSLVLRRWLIKILFFQFFLSKSNATIQAG